MNDSDVAVVGYGPVGALAALLLAESGVRVRILERSTELLDMPRAVGLDGESVRAFQRIGLGDAVAALLQPARERDEVCFTDSKRNRLFGLELPDFGPMGWRDISFFDQPELEAFLRAEVARRPEIDVRLGCDVVALEQHGDHVRLQSTDGEFRASWVLGCDGAGSTVRRAVGIDWLSLGYDQDWLVIDVVQKPGARFPDVTMQVCDPERLTTYVCVKDPNRRWEFQLRPGETREEMLRPETIERLLEPWGAPEHYTLRRAAVYQFHAATAAHWRRGRVFLAGDAAHQTPPFLGQGLNAGFRDAVNLGWKIPLVLRGVCGEALLDSYEAERDAHARDLVEWAVAVGKLMETLAAREAGRPDPHPAVDPSAGYGQGRSAPPLRGGVLAMPESHPLRQPSLRGHGRLDDLLGQGFAVLARKPDDLRMGPAARAVCDALDIRSVCLEGLELERGRFDDLFDAHPAVVLRPDRYVFGVVDGDRDLDRLLDELSNKLSLG